MTLDATGRALFRAALTAARRLQRSRPDGVDGLIRGALPLFDTLSDATPECTVRRVVRERGHDLVGLALRFTQTVRRSGRSASSSACRGTLEFSGGVGVARHGRLVHSAWIDRSTATTPTSPCAGKQARDRARRRHIRGQAQRRQIQRRSDAAAQD
jgi:hypothetical protein